MRRVHVTVRGEVQGVGYRYTMRMVAREAGVAGWVRNLRDGSVEAEIEGSAEQVDEVVAWMAQEDTRRGPYAPCTCGSGRKFRFCHGSKSTQSN